MSNVPFDQMAAQQLEAMSPPSPMPETPAQDSRNIGTPAETMIPEQDGTADIQTPVVPAPDGQMRWSGVAKTLRNGRRPMFGPDYKFVVRPVSGISDKLSAEQQNAVKSSIRRSRMSDGTPIEYYTGGFLVNADGVVVRPPYNVRKDTYDILYSLRPAQLRSVQQFLVASGKYGSGRPQNRSITSRDYNAFADLLEAANVTGVTWDVALSRMIASGGTFGRGGHARRRDNTPDDVAAMITDAVSQRLGRTLTADDVDAVVSALSQQQQQASAPMGQPGDGGQPVDEQASRLVQVVDIFNEMLAER